MQVGNITPLGWSSSFPSTPGKVWSSGVRSRNDFFRCHDARHSSISTIVIGRVFLIYKWGWDLSMEIRRYQIPLDIGSPSALLRQGLSGFCYCAVYTPGLLTPAL